MQILRHPSDMPESSKGGVIAIGNFDGVHLGHQALIARAREIALRLHAPLQVLAFEPHPQEFLHPALNRFRLTPFRTKARLLAQCGVDTMLAFPFDEGIAAMTAEEFSDGILARSLRARTVVIGADFRFGRGRHGNADVLARNGQALGFTVEVFHPVIAHGQSKISSSDIRTALREGKPQDAATLLGHWWTIEGHVQHGDKRGRKLGFPTANLALDEYLEPAFGVYAVRATVMETGAIYKGVANVGIRPMYKTDFPILETYLFDFAGDLYGKDVAVELLEYLRPELNFDSDAALQGQMREDAARALAALDHAGVHC